MDISNLTYKELENLEEEIKKRKTILEKARYKGLVNEVLSAIDALMEAGYGYRDACYDNNGEPYTWEEMHALIRCLL